jgi:hypothetical protein
MKMREKGSGYVPDDRKSITGGPRWVRRWLKVSQRVLEGIGMFYNVKKVPKHLEGSEKTI